MCCGYITKAFTFTQPFLLLFTHSLSSRNFAHNVPSRNYSLETNSGLESARGKQINEAVAALLFGRGSVADFSSRTLVKLLLDTGNVEPYANVECKRNPDTGSPSLLEEETFGTSVFGPLSQ